MMKTKQVLIIGEQGVGKTDLAKIISENLNIPVYDEIATLSELTENEGVYVSNSISIEMATVRLPEGFTLIHIS